jgi:hypothetical protein
MRKVTAPLSECVDGSPTTDAVLLLFSCICIRACKLPDCVCLVNKLKCTYTCKLQSDCQTCINQRKEDIINESYEEAVPDDSDTDRY